MAAPSFTLVESFTEYLGDGTFDMNSDTFKVALYTSTAAPAASTLDILGELSGELAAANGYTAGGFTLSNVTWTRTGTTSKFDADDLTITASGAGLSGIRYFVIYASKTANGRVNPVVGFGLFDSAPADVAIAAGNSATLKWSASGIVTVG